MVKRISYEQVQANRYRAYARTWIAMGNVEFANVRLEMAARWDAMHFENGGK